MKNKKKVSREEIRSLCTKRNNWRYSACKAYVQKRHPEIWDAILNEAYERFPSLRRRGNFIFKCDFMSKAKEKA